MRSPLHTSAATAGALASLAALLALAPPALAAGARDVTADVLANRDVTLSGDTVVTVPSGTTTYDGVFRGRGTLTVRGGGTLVLSKDSDFTLPVARQRQVVRTQGGNHPYTTVAQPDPPAITVERGATLQYGTGGSTGLIGHFPYATPGYRLNQLNVRVDGTLRLSLTRTFNIGTISGAGLVTQPRNMWGTLDLAGSHPFSGVIDNGTGMAVGRPEYPVSLPNARAILNQGSWIIDTPLNQTVTLRQDFYQREYGSDVNVHTRPGSKVVLTGQYSYSDRGGDTDPSLSNPDLNWRPVAHRSNKRGTNIEGADVRWGDGTTHRIFMPGTEDTVYINLHEASGRRSRLTFDYDGPVTLGAPIGGGRYHDTLAAPGAGDVVIAGTEGNDVTFAAAQDYDGSTTVEKGAVLRLGSAQGRRLLADRHRPAPDRERRHPRRAQHEDRDLPVPARRQRLTRPVRSGDDDPHGVRGDVHRDDDGPAGNPRAQGRGDPRQQQGGPADIGGSATGHRRPGAAGDERAQRQGSRARIRHQRGRGRGRADRDRRLHAERQGATGAR